MAPGLHQLTPKIKEVYQIMWIYCVIFNGDDSGRGRPKLTWDAMIKKDMKLLNLREHNC